MKEVTRWRDIKSGNIFIIRNHSLLGKIVGFWADGWAHCGIIYEDDTIEARKHIESRPLSMFYNLWEKGNMKVFDLEADCKGGLDYSLKKLGQHYDWIGDIALFFILPIQQFIWHLKIPIQFPTFIRTKREKCSENVLLYMRCVRDCNPKNKPLTFLDTYMPDKDLVLPASIVSACGEMCNISQITLK
jgi:hypothetical protein